MSFVPLRFWQAGLAAIGGVVAASASPAEAGSFVSVAPPKAAVSSSFAVLEPIPPPVARVAQKPPRSPLDRPPDYRWDARPMAVSASIVAFGTREIEPPKPRPKRPPRRSLARAVPATVIRTGIRGGAFPGFTAVAASQAPSTPERAPQPEAAAAPPPAPLSGAPLETMQ